MSKKHFEAIAAILKKGRIPSAAAGFEEGYDSAIVEVAYNFANMFASENPRFDRDKFLTACGVA